MAENEWLAKDFYKVLGVSKDDDVVDAEVVDDDKDDKDNK